MQRFWPFPFYLSLILVYPVSSYGVDMGQIDQTQQMISDQVIQLSNSLDQFFSSTRAEKESSKSRIRLSTGLLFPYHDRPEPVTQLRANIQLPNTQKRFNVVVENLSETLSESSSKGTGQRSQDPRQAEQVSFSLRYFLIETKKWNAFLETGIKLIVPPDPFVKIRARRGFVYEKWQFRLTGSAFWFQSTGVGHQEIFEIERWLAKNLLFRQFNIINWSIADEITRFSHGYSLFHQYSKRDALVYTLAFNAHNKPIIENTDYIFSINYRRRLFKQWLYLETEPRLTWIKIQNYRPEPSILIKLEFNFGSTG